jgi:hypothetical protein
VNCHGAEDRMLLSKQFLYSLEQGEIDELVEKGGVAFQTKEITSA